MSEIEETAKATQEIAKTVNNALDKAEKAGTFMAKYIDEPLTELSGIWTDKLKYRRWENQLSFWNKANKKLKDLGLVNPSKELPLKLGLPLIEAVSLEEDNELQDLWANLLVNSTTGFSLERSYISVLEQLTKLEAEILINIYSEVTNVGRNSYRIEIDNYPELKIVENEDIEIADIEAANKILTSDESFDEKPYEPIDKATKNMSIDLKLALSNLFRLQCLDKLISFNGGEVFSSVAPTLFGEKLYEAVSDPILKG